MSGQAVAVVPVYGGGREFCSNVWKDQEVGEPRSFVVSVSPTTQSAFTASMKSVILDLDAEVQADVIIRCSFSLYVANLSTSAQVGETLYFVEFPLCNVNRTINFDRMMSVPFNVPVGCALVCKFEFTDYDQEPPAFHVAGNFRWVSPDIVL